MVEQDPVNRLLSGGDSGDGFVIFQVRTQIVGNCLGDIVRVVQARGDLLCQQPGAGGDRFWQLQISPSYPGRVILSRGAQIGDCGGSEGGIDLVDIPGP